AGQRPEMAPEPPGTAAARQVVEEADGEESQRGDEQAPVVAGGEGDGWPAPPVQEVRDREAHLPGEQPRHDHEAADDGDLPSVEVGPEHGLRGPGEQRRADERGDGERQGGDGEGQKNHGEEDSGSCPFNLGFSTPCVRKEPWRWLIRGIRGKTNGSSWSCRE